MDAHNAGRLCLGALSASAIALGQKHFPFLTARLYEPRHLAESSWRSQLLLTFTRSLRLLEVRPVPPDDSKNIFVRSLPERSKRTFLLETHGLAKCPLCSPAGGKSAFRRPLLELGGRRPSPSSCSKKPAKTTANCAVTDILETSKHRKLVFSPCAPMIAMKETFQVSRR